MNRFITLDCVNVLVYDDHWQRRQSDAVECHVQHRRGGGGGGRVLALADDTRGRGCVVCRCPPEEVDRCALEKLAGGRRQRDFVQVLLDLAPQLLGRGELGLDVRVHLLDLVKGVHVLARLNPCFALLLRRRRLLRLGLRLWRRSLLVLDAETHAHAFAHVLAVDNQNLLCQHESPDLRALGDKDIAVFQLCLVGNEMELVGEALLPDLAHGLGGPARSVVEEDALLPRSASR